MNTDGSSSFTRISVCAGPYGDEATRLAGGGRAHQYERVRSFYERESTYITTLPDFHVGGKRASEELLRMALSTGDWVNYKDALELCCGFGSSMIFLNMRCGLQVVGYDLSETMIAECDRRIGQAGLQDHVTCRHGNVTELDESTGQFDVIWSEDSFSHIPGRLGLLRKLSGLLRPDGVFAFSDLLRTGLISDAALQAQCAAWRLWPLETADSYKRKLASAGYVIRCVKSGMGRNLLEWQLEAEHVRGRNTPDEQEMHLRLHKAELTKAWGDRAYWERFERLKSYRYLADGSLDYAFFVCQKE